MRKRIDVTLNISMAEKRAYPKFISEKDRILMVHSNLFQEDDDVPFLTTLAEMSCICISEGGHNPFSIFSAESLNPHIYAGFRLIYRASEHRWSHEGIRMPFCLSGVFEFHASDPS